MPKYLKIMDLKALRGCLGMIKMASPLSIKSTTMIVRLLKKKGVRSVKIEEIEESLSEVMVVFIMQGGIIVNSRGFLND